MLETVMRYVPPGLKANEICRHLFWTYMFSRNSGLKRGFHYGCHRLRLRRLKNIHKGERCFIIGTGPSIERTNLSLLKGEITFGVNLLYTSFPRFGINCTYYTVCDKRVWQDHFKDILGLDTTLFLSGYPGENYLSDSKTFQKYEKYKPFVPAALGTIQDSNSFSKDSSEGLYHGGNVITDICLQVAYYMGFKEVYLLGCDHDDSKMHFYETTKSPTAVGDSWRIFGLYEICKKLYEEDGREIINATVGGQLEVFRRINLEDIV